MCVILSVTVLQYIQPIHYYWAIILFQFSIVYIMTNKYHYIKTQKSHRNL